MATTNLNISVVEKRMMNATEAAHYCGLPAKHFKLHCPVQPVLIPPKHRQYDRWDIDKWLDGLKEGIEMNTRDEIVRLL